MVKRAHCPSIRTDCTNRCYFPNDCLCHASARGPLSRACHQFWNGWVWALASGQLFSSAAAPLISLMLEQNALGNTYVGCIKTGTPALLGMLHGSYGGHVAFLNMTSLDETFPFHRPWCIFCTTFCNLLCSTEALVVSLSHFPRLLHNKRSCLICYFSFSCSGRYVILTFNLLTGFLI